jgi:hypothetical protein
MTRRKRVQVPLALDRNPRSFYVCVPLLRRFGSAVSSHRHSGFRFLSTTVRNRRLRSLRRVIARSLTVAAPRLITDRNTRAGLPLVSANFRMQVLCGRETATLDEVVFLALAG